MVGRVDWYHQVVSIDRFGLGLFPFLDLSLMRWLVYVTVPVSEAAVFGCT